MDSNFVTGDRILERFVIFKALIQRKLSGNFFNNTNALNSGRPSVIGCSSTVLDCRKLTE
jgi:hypothetical protein